jgi:hypothetical protein
MTLQDMLLLWAMKIQFPNQGALQSELHKFKLSLPIHLSMLIFLPPVQVIRANLKVQLIEF